MTTYRVTERFTGYLRLGHTDRGNTFVGSSMALGNVYVATTIRPGATFFDLPGGKFVEIEGRLYEMTLQVSEKHLFEKSYGGVRPDPLPAGLVEIDEPWGNRNRPNQLRFSLDALIAGGYRTWGRSDDFVLSEAEATAEGLIGGS